MAEEYVPLASAADVALVLGRDLTSEEATRIEPILAKASELFRRRSGQLFTPGTSVVRLKVDGGQVYLAQRLVVAVNSVTDCDGYTVTYELFKQWLTVHRPAHEFLTVDYSHGGEVPDVVRLCIAEIGKKVLSIDPSAAAGLTQYGETTGPFSSQSTFATWAQGGQTMLAPDDIVLADSFRVKLGGTLVQR